ncbi:leucine-rich repeat, cysteine-containing subtype protein [Tanacetum coccineum]
MAPSPFRFNQRFPFIESLTLKEFPAYDYEFGNDAISWIREIAVSFKCLKALHIRRLFIDDSDLELLAKTRGNDLRSLQIYKCGGISENGLMYISMYCDKLKTLCVDLSFYADEKGGKWLRELALRNTGIETFSLKLHKELSYYRDIAPLLKSSCKSLVSLRIKEYSIDEIGDALSYTVNLAHLSVAFLKLNVDSGSFKFPSSIRCLGIHKLCPNLEALCVKEVRGDTGMQLIGQFCKKLRSLTFPSGTHTGLIAVAQGCANLELLHVILTDISNEALECIGSNLKSLCDFDIQVGRGGYNIRTSLPLDNGIRAMLIGCTKLERLGIHLYSNAYLTDMGLWFIGTYGGNLRFLSLTRIGESDAGLVELSKGCPKLRKLRMVDCPFSKQTVTGFVFNIYSLRYTWGQITKVPGHLPEYFSATRPNSKASTITSEVPYIILVEETLSSEMPLESIQVQIAEVESRFVSAISVSGDINVEGKLKDGAPHLTKVGDFEVVVSLIEYRYIILSGQVDQTGIIGSIRSILLKEDHVSVCLTSVGRTSIGQQAVMAFLVNWEPKEKALKSIGKISAVKEVVLLTLFL